MSELSVTLIDVGWGDSILLEATDAAGGSHYGLIDSNDTSTLRSSHIFLKRFFERKGEKIPTSQPLFDWVLLSHAHADHGQGLKRILQDFGTLSFWYPKSESRAAFFTDLIRYAGKSSRVEHHQSIDTTKSLPDFGGCPMQVLWPKYGVMDDNENNNSVVLVLTLGAYSFVLAGDAEIEVWRQIAGQLPARPLIFKVPHHGSHNGTIDTGGVTPWLSHCGAGSKVAVSSHIRPFEHPDADVVAALDASGVPWYRTDRHYHINFSTNGKQVHVKYSH